MHFSLEIQMPKRPLVVKTYGRHKYRTVKAQSWLSPDETFLSPFADQSILGDPGAVRGGGKKAGAKKSQERGEEPLGTEF